MELDRDLDLELAWRKTQRDLSHYMNAFADTPYLVDILNSKQDEWLTNLTKRLQEGNDVDCFEPTSPRVIDAPKADYHLRPAHILNIEDIVVYSALMLEVYDSIRENISWSAGTRRFSHILYDDKSSDNRWQDFEREYWREMEERKISLAEEYSYVVETDVSGFYENIDIERAVSVIRQMTGDTEIAMKLWDLLDMWSEPRKRGVPQGYGPSDMIAEAYLDSIDRRLKNHGVDHVRFNDDYVIFTESRDESISIQNLLERQFRSKGLNMKTGKTQIRKATDALADYQEPESVFQELRESIDESGGDSKSSPAAATPYGIHFPTAKRTGESSDSSSQQEDDESDDDSEVSEEVIEQAYQDHIENVSFDELEGHLFRYIINRLGNTDNSVGVEYCRKYIREGRADVRRIIYNYFDDLSQAPEIADALARDITQGKIRYGYHEFILIRWFFESEFDSSDVIHAARQVLSDDYVTILETRDYAIAILSEFGDYSDWEQIEMKYDEEFRSASKAVMAYSLRKFEPRHRGKFYDRIDTSSKIISTAIEAAKGADDGS